MDWSTKTVYTTVAAAATYTLYASAQTLETNDTSAIVGSLGSLVNATGTGGECGQAWIGTIVSAGLFLISEALPFISKSPSSGIIHTIVNGLKGVKKK